MRRGGCVRGRRASRARRSTRTRRPRTPSTWASLRHHRRASRKIPGTINLFLPSRLVIAAGDSVTFTSASFHSVTYNPKPIPLLVPDPAKGTYAGLADAAGHPFYFDDLRSSSTTRSRSGRSGRRRSPARRPPRAAPRPEGPKAPPATATYAFPKPGAYKLFCTLHPGMKATVVVKPAASAVPKTPDQVKAQALAAADGGVPEGDRAEQRRRSRRRTLSRWASAAGVAMLAYYPKVLKVKAGTTVTSSTSRRARCTTSSSGPKKYLEQWEEDRSPARRARGPNQVTPILPYGTDPKPLTYAGATTHGNGFFATPLTAGAPIGLPRSSG